MGRTGFFLLVLAVVCQLALVTGLQSGTCYSGSEPVAGRGCYRNALGQERDRVVWGRVSYVGRIPRHLQAFAHFPGVTAGPAATIANVRPTGIPLGLQLVECGLHRSGSRSTMTHPLRCEGGKGNKGGGNKGEDDDDEGTFIDAIFKPIVRFGCHTSMPLP